MSKARGLANHSLYMARLLLSAWAETQSAAVTPIHAIDAAFAPAVRLHLLDAYGWFLLTSMRATQLPDGPPHCVAELADRAPGIARPAEVSECQYLENTGWLAQLQAPLPKGLARRGLGMSLAIESAYPDISMYRNWARHVEDLFARMSDAIDEC